VELLNGFYKIPQFVSGREVTGTCSVFGLADSESLSSVDISSFVSRTSCMISSWPPVLGGGGIVNGECSVVDSEKIP
jgi:hypothetical protein